MAGKSGSLLCLHMNIIIISGGIIGLFCVAVKASRGLCWKAMITEGQADLFSESLLPDLKLG